MVIFRGARNRYLFVIDIILLVLAMFFAFNLRFDANLPSNEVLNLLHWTPVVVIVRIILFYMFGLYRVAWRYASSTDLMNVIKAVCSGTAVFMAIVVFSRGLVGFPRSVFVIEALLTLFLVGGLRFSLRFYRELVPLKKEGVVKRVLVIGAGDAGNTLIKEILGNPSINYKVVGFIDDDIVKLRITIHGVSVLGDRGDIVRVAEEKHIDEIIIAIPSAGRREIKELLDICALTKANVKVLPHLGDLINGRVSVNNIREVQIEDLLGREVVEIDNENIRKYISGKDILITGAGGSIGSEICRQLLKFNPKSLVLLGRGEHSIYQAHNEFIHINGDTELVQIIGDIINKKKIDGVFKKYKPQIVFHAGADKHVPLLEINPDEAVLNNIIGTKNLIEVAEKYGVEKVVCISTDKAADPVSVMGCTKRIAELIIQGRKNPVTTTMGVRFGNVLGSRGSVIPFFKKQIAMGGPVTVTHPDMIRYFMTIPEAAQLVLQSGAIGSCGEIFLLDMGNPVKIVDLARQMIKLSGFEPDEEIKIKFTGLRRGEKLKESLTGRDEKLFRTDHPKIFALTTNGSTPKCSEEDLRELAEFAVDMDNVRMLNKLKEMVPNYRPQ